ncbi:PACE efflux transporter [bacterium]|nr:PACE efflux transporter [bacterium]
MQGIQRKIVYVALYEGLAIVLSSLALRLLAAHSFAQSTLIAVTTSALAVTWNLIYNSLFEAWEAGRATKGRPVWLRALHAIGFEVGLVLALIPLFAWGLGITLLKAWMLQMGMVAFFLVYSFLFTLGFDRVFGLPASAR